MRKLKKLLATIGTVIILASAFIFVPQASKANAATMLDKKSVVLTLDDWDDTASSRFVWVPQGAQVGIYVRPYGDSIVHWTITDVNGRVKQSGTLYGEKQVTNKRFYVPVGSHRLRLFDHSKFHGGNASGTGTISVWR
ncbi:hypothetical protein CN354_02610 [Bacillus cereus]|nr:hypothetical protein CN354_02610 [Bacillus cereus]WJE55504.1 hypothetical protein QRE66_28570 [Bacillus cereus]